MAKLYSTTNPEISDREKRNMERSRKIASQGMVLLENNGILPLKQESGKIALFGNGARRTVKGGTGSGDVNSRFAINVEQGLETAGFTITTKNWMERYDQAIEDARKAYFGKIREAFGKEGQGAIMRLFTEPFTEPAVVPITEEDLIQADTDTAVYVLARNSGEGKDRRPVAGDYLLFEEEKEAIRCIAGHFEKVIIVLNVGGVIDTEFFRATKGISALLLMSQAGNIGGNALADVLTGKVTPCGHLTTTWAASWQDYPNAATFSHINGNLDDEYYTEHIYVGYRYFDTFNVTPAYPFGYGLSYTSFDVVTEGVELLRNQLSIKVRVTNTGNVYAGKEVVQVYYSSPEGVLEKPYQELAAYGKTKELLPGESEVLTLTYALEQMASYHSGKAAWVLEEGDYFIRVGTHSRNTHIAAKIVLDRDIVTEQLSNCVPLDCKMTLLSSKGVVSYSYEKEAEEKEKALVILAHTADVTCKKAVYRQGEPELAQTEKEEKITVDDVRSGRATLDELVGQLTVKEMAELCVGTARGGFGSESVIGAASAICPGAAGDTTSLMIEDRNIRNMVLADGPAGLRLSRTFMADENGNVIPGTDDAPIAGIEEIVGELPKPEIPADAVRYYQYCTAIPIATLLAQTWDVKVIREAGDIVGEEMEELGVTLWLAPGMNIHRNPLCGRNFEYYSEDPLVSGICAAADTQGVQRHRGVGTTIKHFAFNNQEDNRMHTNAHVDERAAREIYLKGFEIAVRAAQPMSIMTSYNLINGVHAANNRDLLTSIVRDEWGFEGIVMTDWGTTGGMEMNPGMQFKYGTSNAAGCVKAGNDLIMPGSQADVDEIIRSIGAERGSVEYPLTLGELQACVKRILYTIMNSAAYEECSTQIGKC